MARKKIIKFALGWDLEHSAGAINLALEGGAKRKLAFNNPAEFAALVALFSQEKLFYDEAKGILGTGTNTTTS